MMESVPQTPQDIAKLKSAVASMPIYINALVSPDGRSAAVIADFKQDARFPNWIALLAGMRKIIDRERDASVDIHLGGTPIIAEAADVEFARCRRSLARRPHHYGDSVLVIPQRARNAAPDDHRHLERPVGAGGMGLLHVHLDPLASQRPF